MKIFSLFLASVFVFASVSHAAPAPTTDAKKKELPKSGTLSSTGDQGYSSRSVGGPWGDNLGSGASPVTGSVSKMTNDEWMMKVFNNSKDESFRVNLEVVQYDLNQKRLKSDHFSYSLRPGQTETRKIATSESTKNCDLKLLNWTSTGGKKTEEAKADAGAADKGSTVAANGGKPEDLKKTAPPPSRPVTHMRSITPTKK